jgi:hypothetical protein
MLLLVQPQGPPSLKHSRSLRFCIDQWELLSLALWIFDEHLNVSHKSAPKNTRAVSSQRHSLEALPGKIFSADDVK